ncbi:hypothetical protein P153DRAFT_365228 [Dothidotthia symphoricarpi CBS 119687]|uniref:2, 3 cyclic phosphodiesterase n=1 Tax=Dothidotthia symphoricarpi CBS 119687 TaxID=1392245 RepID=A0A6A6AKL4_9PLEO|nr:uncharacterized protein P153DRAFT_365228 [Dothidotthia symphoricarpi CBS 119687]KAF2131658.1 hypothetical protein P153DRAFT_365228 [Dothidotthia symphoricarpi CBS 119687]
MPGSSLWLLPPPSHPLNTLLPSLIKSTSSHFASPHTFLPHITLTSDIPPSTYAADPQTWLDGLALPAGKDVQVKFEGLGSEAVFFRKLYVKCEKNGGMKMLGRVCRQEIDGEEEVEKWVEGVWTPHLSLL